MEKEPLKMVQASPDQIMLSLKPGDPIPPEIKGTVVAEMIIRTEVPAEKVDAPHNLVAAKVPAEAASAGASIASKAPEVVQKGLDSLKLGTLIPGSLRYVTMSTLQVFRPKDGIPGKLYVAKEAQMNSRVPTLTSEPPVSVQDIRDRPLMPGAVYIGPFKGEWP